MHACCVVKTTPMQSMYAGNPSKSNSGGRGKARKGFLALPHYTKRHPGELFLNPSSQASIDIQCYQFLRLAFLRPAGTIWRHAVQPKTDSKSQTRDGASNVGCVIACGRQPVTYTLLRQTAGAIISKLLSLSADVVPLHHEYTACEWDVGCRA
jgi:hypothetical protein